jgi:hypothetical protein
MMVPYVYVLLGRALKRGELKRPLTCEACGHIRPTFAHHDDYLKPLEVRWLCKPCHSKWHRENGPGLNAEIADLPPARYHRLSDEEGASKVEKKDERFDEMARLVSEGWTLKKVGEKYGVTRERVRQIIGSPSKYRRSKAETATELIASKRDEIKTLRAAGKSLRDISLATGIKVSYLSPIGDWAPKLPKPVPHGTEYGYKYYKCRCKACTAASSKSCIDRVRKLRAEGKCIGCRIPSKKSYCDECRQKRFPRKGRKVGRSGISGITWAEGHKAWEVKQKGVYYGSFKNMEDAKKRNEEVRNGGPR